MGLTQTQRRRDPGAAKAAYVLCLCRQSRGGRRVPAADMTKECKLRLNTPKEDSHGSGGPGTGVEAAHPQDTGSHAPRRDGGGRGSEGRGRGGLGGHCLMGTTGADSRDARLGIT